MEQAKVLCLIFFSKNCYQKLISWKWVSQKKFLWATHSSMVTVSYSLSALAHTTIYSFTSYCITWARGHLLLDYGSNIYNFHRIIVSCGKPPDTRVQSIHDSWMWDDIYHLEHLFFTSYSVYISPWIWSIKQAEKICIKWERNKKTCGKYYILVVKKTK